MSTNSDLCRTCYDELCPNPEEIFLGNVTGIKDPSELNTTISPCKCAGSCRLIHLGCLIRECQARQNIICSICQSEFKMIEMKPQSNYVFGLYIRTHPFRSLLMFFCSICLGVIPLIWALVQLNAIYFGVSDKATQIYLNNKMWIPLIYYFSLYQGPLSVTVTNLTMIGLVQLLAHSLQHQRAWSEFNGSRRRIMFEVRLKKDWIFLIFSIKFINKFINKIKNIFEYLYLFEKNENSVLKELFPPHKQTLSGCQFLCSRNSFSYEAKRKKTVVKHTHKTTKNAALKKHFQNSFSSLFCFLFSPIFICYVWLWVSWLITLQQILLTAFEFNRKLDSGCWHKTNTVRHNSHRQEEESEE